MFTMRKANVEIELRGQFTYGASVINFMDQEHANAEIATDVDLEKFAKWFIDSIEKLIKEENNGKLRLSDNNAGYKTEYFK